MTLCTEECEFASSSHVARHLALRYEENSWQIAHSGVHLVALFRDPGIRTGRAVDFVLDVNERNDGSLRAGKNCWVCRFLSIFQPYFETGLTIIIDNGVRCPCPRDDRANYRKHALSCHEKITKTRIKALLQSGRKPKVAICDKDLAEALCFLPDEEKLKSRNGGPLAFERGFYRNVGKEITYLGLDGLILFHPQVANYHYERYLASAREADSQIRDLFSIR